jgi:steroid delta-isomerase-like uncharacterized protein
MTTPALVQEFYERIWQRGEEGAAASLLTADFTFRGSLGPTMHGREPFLGYVRTLRASLSDYACEIVTCVAEGQQAFARMQFSGTHTGPFLGFAPSGKRVAWQGAALFAFRAGRIADLWVLGDLAALEAQLRENALP